MSLTLWGTTLTVRVSSAAPDADPVWVDLSDYVLVPQGATLDTWVGRQNELATSEPGKFALTLDNSDDRFTTGNPTSPYYPWWKQSRRLQIVETVGDKDYVLSDTYIEIPETTVWTQPQAGSPKYLTIAVSGIDVIGRLRNGRPFRPALSEYVIYQGGSDLKGFWPMTESAQPFNGVGPTLSALNMTLTRTGTGGNQVAVQPAAGLAPTAAEASGARMPSDATGPGHAFIKTLLPSDFAPAMAAGDAAVIVFWWAFAPTMSANDAAFHEVVNFNTQTANFSLTRDTTTTQWTLTGSGLSGSIVGGKVPNQALTPVGIYVKESTGVFELWTGSVRQTGTLTGAPAGAGTFTWNSAGYQLDYDMSGIQIYVGNNYTYTNFLNQINFAGAPLDRQPTGTRINNILDWAGFSQARRDIAPGASIMSQVVCGGKTAGQLMDEANTTEQGRLFAKAGRVQFHDRITVLNV